MSRYNFRDKSAFDNGGKIKGIYIGLVKGIGGDLSGVNKTKEGQAQSDQRYQSDSSIIRCEIKGKKFDDDTPTSELPNCIPILPRHINVIPKVGEAVILFIMSGELDIEERLYMGPITSQPYHLNFEKKEETALSSFGFGSTVPDENINNIPSAEGVYAKPSDIVINGRNNADLIFKDSEVLLRAGKFVQNKSKTFNEKDPAYIQIKHNVQTKADLAPSTDDETEKGSVINVVSNKIHLLTHKEGRPRYTLNDREQMISDDELKKIIEKAHPLVFGDKLIDYLKKLKTAFLAHSHEYHQKPPTVGSVGYKEYNTFDLDSLISKNIKIN